MNNPYAAQYADFEAVYGTWKVLCNKALEQPSNTTQQDYYLGLMRQHAMLEAKKNAYEKGFHEGYEEGHSIGYVVGVAEGGS